MRRCWQLVAALVTTVALMNLASNDTSGGVMTDDTSGDVTADDTGSAFSCASFNGAFRHQLPEGRSEAAYSRSIVTAKINGGLGNQLSQILAVVSYAQEHGLDYFFESRKHIPDSNKIPTYLHALGLDASGHTMDHEKFAAFASTMAGCQTIEQRGYATGFTPFPVDAPPAQGYVIELVGKFQNPQYYPPSRVDDIAVSALRFPPEVQPWTDLRERFGKQIDGTQPIFVAIGVRTWSKELDGKGAPDWFVGQEYYEEAWRQLLALLHSPERVHIHSTSTSLVVLLFSDDPALAAQIIRPIIQRNPLHGSYTRTWKRTDDTVRLVLADTNPNGLEYKRDRDGIAETHDLLTLGQCDYLIIGRSSFHWLAAYLRSPSVPAPS